MAIDAKNYTKEALTKHFTEVIGGVKSGKYAPEFLESEIRRVQADLAAINDRTPADPATAAQLRAFGGNTADVDFSAADGVSAKGKKLTVREARLAPLPTALGAAEWKNFHNAAEHNSGYRVTTKSPLSVTGQLPALQIPELNTPLGYEPTRILDNLVATAMSAPTVQYFRHTGNTAEAAITGEGETKPNLAPVISSETATAVKIAGTATVVDELLWDYSSFADFLPREITRSVINAENAYLLGEITGTSGIIAESQGATEATLDAVSRTITAMRTGASFAEPNLIVVHPTTWHEIRTLKDGYQRYILDSAATAATEATEQSLWGIPVITTTQATVGELVFLKTSDILGFVRMAPVVEWNMNGTDFVQNQHTLRAEERISVGVVRPSSVATLQLYSGS